MQNEHIENLVMDSLSTTDDIERGNRELKKAGEKTSMARTAFLSTTVFVGIIFVWDWFI